MKPLDVSSQVNKTYVSTVINGFNNVDIKKQLAGEHPTVHIDKVIAELRLYLCNSIFYFHSES